MWKDCFSECQSFLSAGQFLPLCTVPIVKIPFIELPLAINLPWQQNAP